MEKPKAVREERRNGINAVIFFDRFAVPAWFMGIFVLLAGGAMIAGMFLAKPLDSPWMMLPGILFVAGFILFQIIRLIIFIVKQFIIVNRKDLSGNGEA